MEIMSAHSYAFWHATFTLKDCYTTQNKLKHCITISLVITSHCIIVRKVIYDWTVAL